MRMPLIDGAQLLEQIKERYPDMVRMILSGQSSREAVYRSISPAHQFLSKPCDPQELVARLSQAFAMRDLLANQSLKTVISRLRSIPSLPTLYEELTAALRKEDPSLSQIAKIISKDVGMAAKILQLANSAFVGSSGRVSSLSQALSLIGTETVRTLVLSVHVFSQFENNTASDRQPAGAVGSQCGGIGTGAAHREFRGLREDDGGGEFYGRAAARHREGGAAGGDAARVPSDF